MTSLTFIPHTQQGAAGMKLLQDQLEASRQAAVGTQYELEQVGQPCVFSYESTSYESSNRLSLGGALAGTSGISAQCFFICDACWFRM